MKIQQGLNKGNQLKKFEIGVHPIIQHFIEKLRVSEIIGTYVSSDKRRKIDTENVLCLLIHNYLTSPSPLYEIHDWLQPLDMSALGLSDDESELIYDERVARALDALYASKSKEIFFQLSLRAIKLFDLNCDQTHNDTTSITFSGKYEAWGAKERLAHGHNKDHRPDLKQLVLGITVTKDGAVPIDHQIYSGNQTDDQVHISTHKRLQKLLARTDFIYVADSKLATEQNLKKIDHWGGKFVSIMPRTWKYDEKFKKYVRKNEIKWDLILSRPNSRKPKSQTDHYFLAAGNYSTENGYQIYWIRSTQKENQDAETRARQIHKAFDSLKELQPKINKYNLKTPGAIESKIKSILKENKCEKLIGYKINAHREFKSIYGKPGRPSDNTSKVKTWSEIYTISFFQNTSEVEEQSKMDGIFPLITNLSSDTHPAKQVLEIYKFQPFIEKRHSQLKTYQEVSPVYLKKGDRCVALLHMQVMALMIASLIERNLRLAMKNKKIKSLPIYPEGRECKSPTMFDIVRLFKNIERYEVTQSKITAIYPAKLDPIQKEVLKLLEVPLSNYQ